MGMENDRGNVLEVFSSLMYLTSKGKHQVICLKYTFIKFTNIVLFIFVMISLPYSFIRLQNLVLQRQIVRKPKMRKLDISIKKIGIFSLLLFTFSWCPSSGYTKLSSFWLPLLNEIEESDDYQIFGNPYGSRMVYPVRQLNEKKLLDNVRV